MTLILPEKYKPKHAREAVEVAVVAEEPALAITKQRAEEVAAELRMYVLNSSMVKEIETLGVQVEAVGTVRSANGFTVLTQDFLAKTMMKLVDKLHSGGDAHEVANSLAKLANAMTKASALLKKGGDDKPRSKRPAKLNFVPGQPVVTVNIQNNLAVKSE